MDNDIKSLIQQMMDCRWAISELNRICIMLQNEVTQLKKEVKCLHLFKRNDINYPAPYCELICIHCGQKRMENNN